MRPLQRPGAARTRTTGPRPTELHANQSVCGAASVWHSPSGAEESSNRCITVAGRGTPLGPAVLGWMQTPPPRPPPPCGGVRRSTDSCDYSQLFDTTGVQPVGQETPTEGGGRGRETIKLDRATGVRGDASSSFRVRSEACPWGDAHVERTTWLQRVNYPAFEDMLKDAMCFAARRIGRCVPSASTRGQPVPLIPLALLALPFAALHTRSRSAFARCGTPGTS